MKNYKNIKISSDKSFGLVFFCFFLIISFYPIIDGGKLRYWSLTLSFIFLILGLLNSSILSPLNRLWYKFGLILGSIVSPVVMGVVFFIVITPISLIMKILGKDLLNLKKVKSNTYWIEKKDSKSTMKNQF
ncbi:SxtJ family membrane protein [Candidatus Pelagibacter sp.]|nr:SxtJ family membrane protein [Candidatus Pelagibacter sp.]